MDAAARPRRLTRNCSARAPDKQQRCSCTDIPDPPPIPPPHNRPQQAREYAEKLLAARGGEEAPPAKEKQAREAGWGATAAALGSQFLGGGERPAEAGTAGDKQPGGAGGLMGTAAHMAQGWLAGGEGAAAGEGGHKADPGLVDKLLGLYAQTQGKPVSL